MRKYAIGLDFGTLSGRCVLLDIESGEETSITEEEYRHGVISNAMPNGRRLPGGWALQNPADYYEVLSKVIRKTLKAANVKPGQVVGVGVDATASTLIPIKTDGTPLCMCAGWEQNPYAYAMLWKHHGTYRQTAHIQRVVDGRHEGFIKRYGGKVSQEWTWPKLLQILDEAPDLYAETDYFIDLCDWAVLMLTGELTRSTSALGYKSFWDVHAGYPGEAFMRELHPLFPELVQTKLRGKTVTIGEMAGEISNQGAELTGLMAGTAVATGNLDAHVSALGIGVTKPGKMMMIIGTSACHILVDKTFREIDGISGIAFDGVMPGLYGYEAGQPCVGDQLHWFVENCVPEKYHADCCTMGKDIYAYLNEKANHKAPGETGLLALDWWNGNRSFLMDFQLSGLIVGYSLQTKAEDVYRALIESSAFGTRMIMEAYDSEGFLVDAIYACGGIAAKNPFMMQVYADVTQKNIYIAASSQVTALSSAMFGAIAAGKQRGGYASIEQAAEVAGKLLDKVYQPNRKYKETYDNLYSEYKKLYEYFGRGQNDVMKHLKALKEDKNKEQKNED